MKEEKEPKVKTFYTFDDRLTIKLLGQQKFILRHITALRKIYPAHQMNFSPILKNRNANGFHCFVNIIMEGEVSNEPKREEEGD